MDPATQSGLSIAQVVGIMGGIVAILSTLVTVSFLVGGKLRSAGVQHGTWVSELATLLSDVTETKQALQTHRQEEMGGLERVEKVVNGLVVTVADLRTDTAFMRGRMESREEITEALGQLGANMGREMGRSLAGALESGSRKG